MTAPDQCRKQADWCRRLGSPLYAHLLNRCAADFEQGGPFRDLLEPHHSDRGGWALALQLMGAVHRLVLDGRAPQLARYYPSAGGTVDLDAAWEAFAGVVREQADAIGPLLAQPVQTNDAGRSGSLLGGFLLIAAHTGLPLDLLEIGSSAGLNLCWDRYRYEWAGGGWGDPQSGVRLADVFVEKAPVVPPVVTVAARAGCDLNPLDVNDPATGRTLLAYTWADQVDRIRRLESAIRIARTVPYHVEQTGAADWIESRLAAPVRGNATVVFHSVVWPYLKPAEQQRFTTLVEEAGSRASSDAPLAWLRMEPGADQAEVRLRIYPGFEEKVIAATDFHTPVVKWSA